MRIFFAILLITIFSLHHETIIAQSDECFSATPLSNVNNYCSSVGEFDNIGASPSGAGQPGCFPSINNGLSAACAVIANQLSDTASNDSAANLGAAWDVYQSIC